MKHLNKPFRWILTKFRTHPVRSLMIAIPVLTITVLGILWGSGAFTEDSIYVYLPDREYALAPIDLPDPQTLKELLHSDLPDIDTLLKNPAIAQELAQAKELTDIVDSRLALNNLRSLDQQLTERLKEESPVVIDLLTTTADHGGNLSGFSGSPGKLVPMLPAQTVQVLENQHNKIVSLKFDTYRLLNPPELGELISFPSTMNIKGIWQSPDEALIHMVPSGDWLPEEGYKLYRVVNGQKVLIAEKLASPANGLAGDLKIDDADMIQQLYIQAELTPDKLNILGMSAKEFRETAYRTYSSEFKPRVDGEFDFLAMKQALITIPAGIEQKIPQTDLLLSLPITVLGKQQNGLYVNGATKTSVWKKFSVIQAEMPAGIDVLKLQPAGEAKFSLAKELLVARQHISTLAFVDDEFAEAAGFLVRDDLSGLNLSNGTEITYVVETPTHINTTFPVTKGVENNLTKPQRLLGYGIDGKVPLRWAEAETKQERSILSGYHIERKLDGEKEFIKITDEPVVITHILDETNHYFQSPVFYEDTVDNGRTAEYRIYSIDIFGRRSEYSDTFSLRVEKVTPPNAPAVETPELTHDGKKRQFSSNPSGLKIDLDVSPVIKLAQNINPGQRGVVLPIFTDSADTVRFTIYRAVAVGARKFGSPVAITNIEYDNPKADLNEEQSRMLGLSQVTGGQPESAEKKMYRTFSTKKGLFSKTKHMQLSTPTSLYPDLIYFDADIEEGCTYKYWVSAWDSWNNESAWSQAISMAVPSNVEPEEPDELFISMHQRTLIDTSAEPPGMLYDGVVSFDELAAGSHLPDRPATEGVIIETVQNAIADGVTIGSFHQNFTHFPSAIDFGYNNLPEDQYIHMFIGVRGEDVFPDGTAHLKWPAYSGENLGGYIIYRPLFKAKDLEEMQQMSRTELLRVGRWERMNASALTQNQLLVSGVNSSPESLALFLVCLEPKTPESNLIAPVLTGSNIAQLVTQTGFISQVINSLEGGYVYIDWNVPDDPQTEFYRVYRSEVPSFKKPVDESKLEWTMVADRLMNPKYTERVEQSFAHYYYYKVTSVSPWGVESTTSSVQRFRVPSTKPPQTPNLLLPLQTKDGVKVQFSAVSHCDRYEIYRATIPKPGEKDINALLSSDREVHEALFSSPAKEDIYLTNLLKDSLIPYIPFSSGSGEGSSTLPFAMSINPIGKLKTITNFNITSVRNSLATVDDVTLRSAYKRILDKYGPLALADYKDLSANMMRRVQWVKVGEMAADYDTVEETGPLGLLKPLSITDTTAMYGVRYLYTVQAWNDDNLGSSRPEPVEATPRRNRAFDPIDGLVGEIDENNKPSLKWNTPKIFPLTPEKCLDDTVGYIVYRSDTIDGTYYQASPLLFDNKWVDENADPNAFNWYKVKVLDTGGYLSEFSLSVMVKLPIFVPSVMTVIPAFTPDEVAISFDVNKYTITEGEAFETIYNLKGSGAIAVTIKAAGSGGTVVGGFSVDQAARKIKASNTLAPGAYYVTATAKGITNEISASFTLTVLKKTVQPVITFDNDKFTVTQGESFETKYNLTGTDPVTVTIKAVKEESISAVEFILDQTSKKVSAKSDLKAGTYLVTVTAKNTVGEASASFTLTVSSEPVITAPQISFDGKEFNSVQGEVLSTGYKLTGTEPVIVTMKANTADGISTGGFILDQVSHKVSTEQNLKAGTYLVTITAKNAGGEVSASFTLTVSSKPVITAPTISFDGKEFNSMQGEEFSTGYELDGTEPISVTIKAIAATGVQTEGFILDQASRKISIEPGLKAGTYLVIVIAKNSAGESSASFTLTVSSKPVITAPTISLDGKEFNSIQGEEFSTIYELTGTEPITVTIKAVAATGMQIEGFLIDQALRKISTGQDLKVGTYLVTVTAKNDAGESSTSFALNVSERPKVTAPAIFFDGNSFNSIEGEEFGTIYELTGTEPITVTVTAKKDNVDPLEGFSVDQEQHLVKAGSNLTVGRYIVTVTAQNAAGQNSASFTLSVQPKLAVSPKLAVREDDYNFKMTVGPTDFAVKLWASGTEPFRWSLKSALSRINTLPAEVGIDNTGLLTVKKEVKTGTYNFIVRVENEVGADERVINLEVTAGLRPITPIRPNLFLNPFLFLSSTDILELSNVIVQPATTTFDQSSGVPPSQSLAPKYNFETDLMKCMGFDLTNVKFEKNPFTELYTGTAMMDIGYDTPINVWVKDAELEVGEGRSSDILKKGAVYLLESVELDNIGLTIVSLDVSPAQKRALVSGYLKSPISGQNLAGDLYAFEFQDAKIEPGYIIIKEGLPQIRYKQFTFESLNYITIRLGVMKDPNRILLWMSGNGIFMKSHLETLSNEGLQFEKSTISFDLQGKMDATFATTKEQCLQMLVPGGAALRIEKANLQFENGEVKQGGQLKGKLVLPFEKDTAGGSVVPAVYAGRHPAHNEMDDLASGEGELTEGEMVVMGDTLVHYGETVQQNSLLIVPASYELQDKCASVPIVVNNWDGEGFVIESSTMDPVRVTNRNVSGGSFQNGQFIYTQRAQAVIVSPVAVSVDLNRNTYLPGQGNSQTQGSTGVLTPKETEQPFWVGIIIKGGKLALPSAYLKQADGGIIEFNLTEGEMIYDLNGFNYQTYIMGSDPNGVPASFGDSLGGFGDVRIKDCLLDMYANRVNLEINAKVKIDLFHHKWVEAKLFTDEKDKFICSVAPTVIENGLAKDIDLVIDGGFFEPEGMRINGKLVLPQPGTDGFEIGSADPLVFSDMMVPSDLEEIREQDGTNIYGAVQLDKPVKIDFEGFPMEIRKFDIRYSAPKILIVPTSGIKPTWLELTLHGATQLSDTIALSNDTTDILTVKCADDGVIPLVLHNKSSSVLTNSFDGCVDVTGKLIPKKINGSGGHVEFETDKLSINFLGQNLTDLPVTHHARFGKVGDEFYFAVGLTPLNGKPINFGAGNIDKFTGLIAQNMQVGKDAQGKLTFPDKAGDMQAYIKNLQVGGGSFSGGIKGEMTVIKLCTIKDLYFGFEPGPKVTAGGDVYMPLDIQSIVNGNPTKHMGKAVIQYRHPDQYFSFNMTFDRVRIVLFDFGGSMGMEYSPRLFGVQIGYPETLFTNFQLGPLPVRVGVGLGFRIDQDSESMVQAKFEFGLEKDIKVAIVYLHGYIYAGADGAYYWNGPDGNRISLDLYLKGGINGGIRAFGKRYNIINFYLDARGTLVSGGDFNSWEIGCRCTVGYSLDLWLAEIEGSVSASFDTTIAW